VELKRKKEKQIKGYNKDQLKNYNDLVKQYNEDSTVDQLKDILRKNNQRMTGSKKELAERVADGEVLGSIPRCSECGGGHLRFNHITGEYRCPGYMDDDVYKFCKFKGMDVKRESWV